MTNNENIITTVTEERLRAFVGRKRHWHCSVRPRYAAGSGASVSVQIALGVAQDEVRCYEHAREGAYGEAQREKAEKLGLFGIAECMIEERKCWRVLDLITGEVYDRPFPDTQSRVRI